MPKYSVGDKVVLNEKLFGAQSWFEDEFVFIKALDLNDGNYIVEPVHNPERDYSYVAEHEINHEATEQLNK